MTDLERDGSSEGDEKQRRLVVLVVTEPQS